MAMVVGPFAQSDGYDPAAFHAGDGAFGRFLPVAGFEAKGQQDGAVVHAGQPGRGHSKARPQR